MIEHHFTCGCIMFEGHPKSVGKVGFEIGDYRETSCPKHAHLPTTAWPHHRDDGTERLPNEFDLLAMQLVGEVMAARLDPNIPEPKRSELQRKLRR
jgi:hypothetical protein